MKWGGWTGNSSLSHTHTHTHNHIRRDKCKENKENMVSQPVHFLKLDFIEAEDYILCTQAHPDNKRMELTNIVFICTF